MIVALIIGILLALAGGYYLMRKGSTPATGSAGGVAADADPTVRVPIIFSPNGRNRGIVGSDGDPTRPGDQAYPAWRRTAEGQKGYRDVRLSEIRRIFPDATIEGDHVIAGRSSRREGGVGHPVLVVREVHRTPGLLGGDTWQFVSPSWELSSSGNTAAVVLGVAVVAGATVAGTLFGGAAGGAAGAAVGGAIAEQIR